ncbi:SdpA family antimicrobial peptide system protein [Lacinutrix neustonica]|uniref:SdpA family antimicrobial peptide system protein n=1 Tax=Lacinutrix neustonica TaxID=2980107 RepID=A0A9E8SD74_9FLAO|nr:SdpA family antimicrobial peptide system protein [Lacinutrix neustonica]WAC01791.1 SdpA family antimicrobial peptide system protein [Lacinutrix neustonica]
MKHVLLLFGFVIVFGYLHINFITSLGDNVMNVSTSETKTIQTFFPQGWGFFTGDPREPKYRLYKIVAGELHLVNFRITSSDNYFGLSRKGSRIGLEVLRIKNKLPQTEAWEPSAIPLKNMQLNKLAYECIEPVPGLLYIEEGNYILKEYQTTPWSWAKYQGPYSKNFKYIPFQLVKS